MSTIEIKENDQILVQDKFRGKLYMPPKGDGSAEITLQSYYRSFEKEPPTTLDELNEMLKNKKDYQERIFKLLSPVINYGYHNISPRCESSDMVKVVEDMTEELLEGIQKFDPGKAASIITHAHNCVIYICKNFVDTKLPTDRPGIRHDFQRFKSAMKSLNFNSDNYDVDRLAKLTGFSKGKILSLIRADNSVSIEDDDYLEDKKNTPENQYIEKNSEVILAGSGRRFEEIVNSNENTAEVEMAKMLLAIAKKYNEQHSGSQLSPLQRAEIFCKRRGLFGYAEHSAKQLAKEYNCCENLITKNIRHFMNHLDKKEVYNCIEKIY